MRAPVRRARMRTATALAALAAAAPAAWAEPKRAALVNAAADQPAGAAAVVALRAELAAGSELAPLAPSELSAALEDPLPDENDPAVALALADATGLLERARDAVAHFDHAAAVVRLDEAERKLAALPPEAGWAALMADVNLEAGMVHIARQEIDLAVERFRVVRRIAPDRAELDPARYLPEVVSAYRLASQPLAASASVRVTAPPAGGVVWIDGLEVGPAPHVAALEPGIHYVACRQLGFAGAAVRVDARPGDAALEVTLAPLPPPEQARAIRRALVAEAVTTPPVRWPGRAELPALTGAQVLVLVIDVRGPEGTRLMARLYRVDEERYEDPVLVGPGAAEALVAPLRPLVPDPAELARRIKGGGGPTTPPPEPEPWYRRRWGMATIGGGVVAALVGAIFLSRVESGPGTRDGAWGPGFSP